MTRGRKPKPTDVKIFNGNPGKRPLNKNEPKTQSGFPDPPAYLSEREQSVWHEMAELLSTHGVGGRLDARALEMLTVAWVAYLDATAELTRSGPVWIESSDAQNPLDSLAADPPARPAFSDAPAPTKAAKKKRRGRSDPVEQPPAVEPPAPAPRRPTKIPKFVYSPYWVVANREWKKVLMLLTEFGLTPSSRSRVTSNAPQGTGGVARRKQG